MKKYILLFVFISFFILGILNGCKYDPNVKEKSKNEKVEVKSEEDAKKFADGTWQFIDPGYEWFKFVIRPNGICEIYRAKPKDGKWTYDVQGNWTIQSNRSETSGKKYFLIKITYIDKLIKTNDVWELPFEDSQTIYSGQLQIFGTGIGRKTDINPWN